MKREFHHLNFVGATGTFPMSVRYPIFRRAADENESIPDAAFSLDLEVAYQAFEKLNMRKHLESSQKRELFDEMIAGTCAYLKDYR